MDVHFALLRACGRVRVDSIAAPRFGFFGASPCLVVVVVSDTHTQYEAGRLLLLLPVGAGRMEALLVESRCPQSLLAC